MFTGIQDEGRNPGCESLKAENKILRNGEIRRLFIGEEMKMSIGRGRRRYDCLHAKGDKSLKQIGDFASRHRRKQKAKL